MTRLREVDAYVTGELADGAAAEAFEEALFDAPDDPAVVFVDALARHGAILAAHGTFDMGVTRAHVDQLIASGHTIEIVDLGPPRTGRVTIRRGAEFVVNKTPLGRPELGRVDMEIVLVDANVSKTIRDVLVDPSDGHVYGLCERPLAELAYSAGRTIVRVRERSGARAVLGEWDLVAEWI